MILSCCELMGLTMIDVTGRTSFNGPLAFANEGVARLVSLLCAARHETITNQLGLSVSSRLHGLEKPPVAWQT